MIRIPQLPNLLRSGCPMGELAGHVVPVRCVVLQGGHHHPLPRRTRTKLALRPEGGQSTLATSMLTLSGPTVGHEQTVSRASLDLCPRPRRRLRWEPIGAQYRIEHMLYIHGYNALARI